MFESVLAKKIIASDGKMTEENKVRQLYVFQQGKWMGKASAVCQHKLTAMLHGQEHRSDIVMSVHPMAHPGTTCSIEH